MSLYPSSSRSGPSRSAGASEFEILKSSHKFLRDDEEDERHLSWDDALAAKYYASLYREFAVCDLKHYKSGQFALRWRTEKEVLSGAGESSCGNTRCEHHDTNTSLQPPKLTTLELPFAYEERGESKSALVKVALCPRCLKKLMWKRQKEKERDTDAGAAGVADEADDSKRERKSKPDGSKDGKDSRTGRDSREKRADISRQDVRDDVGAGTSRRRASAEEEVERPEVGSGRKRRASRSMSPHDKRRALSQRAR